MKTKHENDGITSFKNHTVSSMPAGDSYVFDKMKHTLEVNLKMMYIVYRKME